MIRFLLTLLLGTPAAIHADTIQSCGNLRYMLYFAQSTKSTFSASLPRLPGVIDEVTNAIYPVFSHSVYGLVRNTDIENRFNVYDVVSKLTDGGTFSSTIQNTFSGSVPLTASGSGSNSNAFTVMYRMAMNKHDTGEDVMYDSSSWKNVKIMIVISDGIPQFKGCYNKTPNNVVTKHPDDLCCEWDSGSRQRCPDSLKANDFSCIPYDDLKNSADYPVNSTCPIDLPSLSNALIQNDFFVIYVNTIGEPYTQWDFLLTPDALNIKNRFTSINTNYNYQGLGQELIKSINYVGCTLYPATH